MKLETYYHIKVIPLIRNFITEAAIFYGASNKECYEIELASEEAANHIIANYLGNPEDKFEIIIETDLKQNIFKIIMINKGLPVNENEIPNYVVEQPEKSIDGLQFYLIRKNVDKFYFLNCGKDGWRTVIEKKFENFQIPLEKKKRYAVKKHYNIEDIEIKIAEPDHAYDITKLAYLTYRYSYGRSLYYYPEVLKESIGTGEVISFIAVTPENEIVAHTGYIKSRNGDGIFESVALMAKVEVRKTFVIPNLLKFQYEYSIENSDKIKIVEIELVTGHTSSQKIASLYKFYPFALFISYYDQSEFVGIDIPENRQRETILYSLRPTKELLKTSIYTPECHKDFLKLQFSGNMFNTKIVTECSKVFIENTELSISRRKDMSLAIIEIKNFGKSWIEKTKKIIKQLRLEHFKTIFFKIHADKPLPEKLEQNLNSLGFFFSGIILGPINRWSLLYIHLVDQKINWDDIKLYDEKAILLKNYIKENYVKVNEF